MTQPAEKPCPYTGIAYENVPGYIPGYGCPVCKAISWSHLTVAPLLAWEVEIHSMSCVVFAATKAKARWTAVKSYWEAFGRGQGWPHCSVARRPLMDSFKGEVGRAYTPEYVRAG